MHALHLIDGYKADHRSQYTKGTSLVFSNFTARSSRVPGVDKVVFFGMQYFVKKYLIEEWGRFFKEPKAYAVARYERRMDHYLGKNAIDTEHIEALHDLGYLPVCIMALPEGTLVPLRVPMCVIWNTDDRFFWLPNYLETLMSCVLWGPITSATTAMRYSRILHNAASRTGGDPEFVKFQGHDFSMRGMFGVEAAELSGAAHLTSFAGTDSIPAIDFLEKYYGADCENELVGVSVPATEHSVMCLGGEDDEIGTFRRLVTEVYPKGIVSIVSDSWDFWRVVTEYLPALKDVIMARDGKVVIRPDSGDPADILCGIMDDNGVPRSAQGKGLIECLWDIFGGAVNANGFKVLDPHIGAIYGDSITPDRCQEICDRLATKGFASTNVVFGIGSYTYQYVTRDTYGMAMKATYGVVNGDARNIFKKPKTDSGLKNSAKGLLTVHRDGMNGSLFLEQESSWEQLLDCAFCKVFEDGNLLDETTLSSVRYLIKAQLQ